MTILNHHQLQNFPSVPNFKIASSFSNFGTKKNFGSPSLRKINEKIHELRWDTETFEIDMAKHGFLKDLNELNSFSNFYPSPVNTSQ